MLHSQDFAQARQRLRPILHRFPLSCSETFSKMSGSQLYLKTENLQKTGSFKVRGAANKILALQERGELSGGVVAASAGNHAQGVAFAARSAGVPATIVMPQGAPLAKIAATEGYGAQVVLHGSYYDEAFAHAQQWAQQSGARMIHPFDDEEVIAGQGTIALEILEQVPDVNVILAPVGGGGLLAGIARCCHLLAPEVKVIGVQAAGASSAARLFRQPEAPLPQRIKTIADGIAVRQPGRLTMDIIRACAADVVTVTDDEIASAILLLLERAKLLVEPAGATTLAAMLSGRLDFVEQKVVCVLSGGNIDVAFIHKVVEKGLINRGRQIRFFSVVADTPGVLAEFSSLIARENGNILSCEHDRTHEDLELDQAGIHAICEVSGPEHARRLLQALQNAGYVVYPER